MTLKGIESDILYGLREEAQCYWDDSQMILEI